MKLVVKIGGGLGNQMFQYALASYLAKRSGGQIFFDLTDFTVSKLRTFQLMKFVGPSKVSRWGVVNEWLFFILWVINRKISSRLFQIVLKILGVKWLYVRNPMIYQPEFNDDNILKGCALGYLSGCYGHIDHLPIRQDLRVLFSLKEGLSPANSIYEEAIEEAGEHSVSVHIRRGDYLWASNGAPVLPETYWVKAIEFMNKNIDDIKWFVFSDDLEWCKNKFRSLSNAIFVNGNLDKPWEDLHLMSLCKHHVIANSTFSWWGAYLGADDGVTVYPKPWFKSRKNELDCVLPVTAVPKEWIAIDYK